MISTISYEYRNDPVDGYGTAAGTGTETGHLWTSQGMQPGDLILVFVRGIATASVISHPITLSGFTLVAENEVFAFSEYSYTGIYSRFYEEGDPISFAYDVSASFDSSHFWQIATSSYRGVDPDNPFDIAPVTASTTSADDLDFGTITSVTDNAMGIVLMNDNPTRGYQAPHFYVLHGLFNPDLYGGTLRDAGAFPDTYFAASTPGPYVANVGIFIVLRAAVVDGQLFSDNFFVQPDASPFQLDPAVWNIGGDQDPDQGYLPEDWIYPWQLHGIDDYSWGDDTPDVQQRNYFSTVDAFTNDVRITGYFNLWYLDSAPSVYGNITVVYGNGIWNDFTDGARSTLMSECYALEWDVVNYVINLVKYSGGTYTVLDSVAFSLDYLNSLGDFFSYALQITGSGVTAKIWKNLEAEPVSDTLVSSDTSISGTIFGYALYADSGYTEVVFKEVTLGAPDVPRVAAFKPAHISGPVIDSQRCFLNGTYTTITDSQPSYLRGLKTLTDNQRVYVMGPTVAALTSISDGPSNSTSLGLGHATAISALQYPRFTYLDGYADTPTWYASRNRPTTFSSDIYAFYSPSFTEDVLLRSVSDLVASTSSTITPSEPTGLAVHDFVIFVLTYRNDVNATVYTPSGGTATFYFTSIEATDDGDYLIREIWYDNNYDGTGLPSFTQSNSTAGGHSVQAVALYYTTTYTSPITFYSGWFGSSSNSTGGEADNYININSPVLIWYAASLMIEFVSASKDNSLNTTGITFEQGTHHIYINGTHTEVSTSVGAYTYGVLSLRDSQPAYVEAAFPFVVDSNSLYVKGSGISTSNVGAFIFGRAEFLPLLQGHDYRTHIGYGGGLSLGVAVAKFHQPYSATLDVLRWYTQDAGLDAWSSVLFEASSFGGPINIRAISPLFSSDDGVITPTIPADAQVGDGVIYIVTRKSASPYTTLTITGASPNVVAIDMAGSDELDYIITHVYHDVYSTLDPVTFTEGTYGSDGLSAIAIVLDGAYNSEYNYSGGGTYYNDAASFVDSFSPVTPQAASPIIFHIVTSTSPNGINTTGPMAQIQDGQLCYVPSTSFVADSQGAFIHGPTAISSTKLIVIPGPFPVTGTKLCYIPSYSYIPAVKYGQNNSTKVGLKHSVGIAAQEYARGTGPSLSLGSPFWYQSINGPDAFFSQILEFGSTTSGDVHIRGISNLLVGTGALTAPAPPGVQVGDYLVYIVTRRATSSTVFSGTWSILSGSMEFRYTNQAVYSPASDNWLHCSLATGTYSGTMPTIVNTGGSSGGASIQVIAISGTPTLSVFTGYKEYQTNTVSVTRNDKSPFTLSFGASLIVEIVQSSDYNCLNTVGFATTITDSQPAYIVGPYPITDSQGAFIKGPNFTTSSKNAYIGGIPGLRGSKRCYIRSVTAPIAIQGDSYTTVMSHKVIAEWGNNRLNDDQIVTASSIKRGPRGFHMFEQETDSYQNPPTDPFVPLDPNNPGHPGGNGGNGGTDPNKVVPPKVVGWSFTESTGASFTAVMPPAGLQDNDFMIAMLSHDNQTQPITFGTLTNGWTYGGETTTHKWYWGVFSSGLAAPIFTAAVSNSQAICSIVAVRYADLTDTDSTDTYLPAAARGFMSSAGQVYDGTWSNQLEHIFMRRSGLYLEFASVEKANNGAGGAGLLGYNKGLANGFYLAKHAYGEGTPAQLHLTDTTVEDATAWNWYVFDETKTVIITTSTDENPTFTLPAPAIYYVQLVTDVNYPQITEQKVVM